MKDIIIEFRPIVPGDLPFLKILYGSTRTQELDLISNWTEAQKLAFIDQQFHAQHTFYQEHFGEAKFSLVLMDNIPIGRLYLDRRKDEIRIIDIALLPEFRGKGIGSQMMQQILQEGDHTEKPVRIHVEQNNPALRLYERLGFNKIGDTGVYFLMEWLPASLKEFNK